MATDKDTWIAENIFPKNTELNSNRKPRLNVESVDVSYATRSTKLTFCVLGSWAIYMPPYNLARLSSLTRESGYLTRVYDFNIQSYYDLKESNPELKDAWLGANYWMWSESKEYFSKIHPYYKTILQKYLDLILSQDPDIIGFCTYYTNYYPTIWMIDKIKKIVPGVKFETGISRQDVDRIYMVRNPDEFGTPTYEDFGATSRPSGLLDTLDERLRQESY